MCVCVPPTEGNTFLLYGAALISCIESDVDASGLSLNSRLSVTNRRCHVTHEQSCRIYFFIWAAHDVT